MPDKLHQQRTPADFRDLVAFLAGDRTEQEVTGPGSLAACGFRP
jgi:hypothetical protein